MLLSVYIFLYSENKKKHETKINQQKTMFQQMVTLQKGAVCRQMICITDISNHMFLARSTKYLN